MKKVTLILGISLLLLALGGSQALAQDIKVFVDNDETYFPDQKPLINSDNRTLVPVRFVSQALGAKVDWNALQRTAKIDYKGKTILLEIGVKQAAVGTSPVALDTAPDIVNNRTMVPLRFVSECLGAKVEWNGAKQEVYITTLEFQEDKALINSDLILRTPPGHRNNVELTAIVDYRYNVPIEPQMVDLRKLLEKRLGSKSGEVMQYILQKTNTAIRLDDKDWLLDGMLINVSDGIGFLGVTIWINGGPPKR